MTLGTRLSGQRSGAEAAFQCGQRNSLKTINVDGEHFIRFRGKSCVFKFIRLSVDEALVDVMSAHDSQFARFTNVFLYFFLSLSGLSNQIGFFFTT